MERVSDEESSQGIECHVRALIGESGHGGPGDVLVELDLHEPVGGP
jgi:hypothetical protein